MTQGGRETARAPASRASRIADRLEAVLNGLLAAMLAVLVVCLCYQVFGRYVLDDAPGWTEEVARFLVVYITMIGAAAVVWRDGHVTVNVLVDAMPPRIRAPFLWFRDAVVLACAGVLMWFGWGLAGIGGHRTSPALEISMFWPFLAIPVSGALIAVFLALGRLSPAGESR